MKQTLLLGLFLTVLACTNTFPKDATMGEQINFMRNRCQMSIEALADSLDVSKETLELVESNQSTLIHTKWARVEQVLGFKINHKPSPARNIK